MALDDPPGAQPVELATDPTEPAGPKAPKLLWPMLVKPHPMLDAYIRPMLVAVAKAAKAIEAHYRFYAFTESVIAFDPAYVAPPVGDPYWEHAGSDWAAGTVAAQCSSFVWAAVQNANRTLYAEARPTIVREGAPEPDERQPGRHDGLYRYEAGERRKAGDAMYTAIHEDAMTQIDAMIQGPVIPHRHPRQCAQLDGHR